MNDDDDPDLVVLIATVAVFGVITVAWVAGLVWAAVHLAGRG